jgi:hypothetical protein
VFIRRPPMFSENSAACRGRATIELSWPTFLIELALSMLILNQYCLEMPKALFRQPAHSRTPKSFTNPCPGYAKGTIAEPKLFTTGHIVS